MYGKEDNGRVVFEDTDEDLTIYLSFADLENRNLPVDLLSEKFIDYCGISDPKCRQVLAYIIAVNTLSAEDEVVQIRRILESSSIDEAANTSGGSSNFFSHSGSNTQSILHPPQMSPDFTGPTSSEQSFSPVSDDSQEGFTPPTPPHPATNEIITRSRSRPSISLPNKTAPQISRSIRERIPTLDDSIGAVAAKARKYDSKQVDLLAPTHSNHQNEHLPPASLSWPAGNARRSPRMSELLSSPSGQSTPGTSIKRHTSFERQSSPSLAFFGMTALRSALPSITTNGIPTRTSQMWGISPPSRPSALLDDEDDGFEANRTGVQALVYQLVGLLGEVFVSSYSHSINELKSLTINLGL